MVSNSPLFKSYTNYFYKLKLIAMGEEQNTILTEKKARLEERKKSNLKLLSVASKLMEKNDQEGASVILGALKDFKLSKSEWDSLVKSESVSEQFAEFCILEMKMIKKSKSSAASTNSYDKYCGYPSLKKVAMERFDHKLAESGLKLRTAINQALESCKDELEYLASKGYTFTHYLRKEKE